MESLNLSTRVAGGGRGARRYTGRRHFEIGLLGVWLWGLGWRFLFGLPGVGIVRGFGIDAEIPDIEIHSFRAFHFDQGIFAWCEGFGGSEFEPSAGDTGDGGFDEVLLLADFASDLALDVADDAL